MNVVANPALPRWANHFPSCRARLRRWPEGQYYLSKQHSADTRCRRHPKNNCKPEMLRFGFLYDGTRFGDDIVHREAIVLQDVLIGS